MDPVPLVRAGAFLPFISFLEHRGSPIERRLQDVMIPNASLNSAEALVPLDQALRFLEKCAMEDGIPDLGVQVGAETHLPDLGLFGQLILHSVTLRNAIQKIAQVTSYYNSAQRVWLEPWHGKVRLCHRFHPRLSGGRRYGEQFTMMLIVDAVRVFAGRKWQPDEIHVDGSSWDLPVNGDLPLLDTRVRSQDVSAIVFDPVLLSLSTCAVTRDWQKAEARERRELMSTAPARDFVGSLEQIVRMFLLDDRFGLEQTAEIVGGSPRTLQRRLAESGLEYSELVDRVRFKAAIELMKRGAKLVDVALELGYSDQANFTRAFRRWSGGVAPSRFMQEWKAVHPRAVD